jgi:glutamate/tyrosine decarboxylase-like PLP-dependent enzyme
MSDDRFLNSNPGFDELAECGDMTAMMREAGEYLDEYLRFEHGDAVENEHIWRNALGGELPQTGVGKSPLLREIGEHLIPNGSQIPKPGCSSFITTGATSVGALMSTVSATACPQRQTVTAFHYLEDLSLRWMGEMFSLPSEVKGVYSTGGSVANLVALGAARQWAFERMGLDPALDGITRPCRIYASAVCHHTIQRSAAVLGLGRASVRLIDTDRDGRMCPKALKEAIEGDNQKDIFKIAVVANAGATDTGVIDPLRSVGEIAKDHDMWFHIDGAYGLPGILDPDVAHHYDGLDLMDSVIVDPHKWLGAPVGIAATFVRDRSLLERAFTQGTANYLEGSFIYEGAEHSMDSFGIPYSDFGVELSSPPRGATVWALIKEIGVDGMRARICRHNAMARYIAERAKAHDNLELALEPMLSVCCFRYYSDQIDDLNELNRRVHRRLVRRGNNIPSTTIVDGNLVIRPCFVGARSNMEHAVSLVDEVLEIGDALMEEING